MSKKNLPNIPIYIGDWERDCNVLSLEAEAAWMRIVFKLWTKGKQNTIKMPAKSLQNLWRCGSEVMNGILDELRFNNICGVNTDGDFVEFTCRRFVKENQISEIRSKAAKGEKEAAKFKQTKSKLKAKSGQNAENDYDNESEYEVNDEEVLEKSEKPLKNPPAELEPKMPWDTESFRTQWQHWKVYKRKEHKFKYASIQSEQAALTDLANKSAGQEKTAIKIIHQSMAAGWKGFFELKGDSGGKKRKSAMDNILSGS